MTDTGLERGPTTPVYFQYIGRKQLSVIGGETRNRYRFDTPGMVLEVDPRDGISLRAVPLLRLVRKKDG